MNGSYIKAISARGNEEPISAPLCLHGRKVSVFYQLSNKIIIFSHFSIKKRRNNPTTMNLLETPQASTSENNGFIPPSPNTHKAGWPTSGHPALFTYI